MDFARELTYLAFIADALLALIVYVVARKAGLSFKEARYIIWRSIISLFGYDTDKD